MSYLVLARKYRPASFDEIIGQQHVTQTLKNGIEKNKVHHAFLFTGTRGVGKTTTARVLAKALNCQAHDGPTPEPCGECVACKAIAAGQSVDVNEIDGASNNSVNDIRDLRDNVQYRPQQTRYKIYIIDEVHMLSTPAFNALLKTLEEPPDHVKFIFATTESHKIPQTILSRCQRYDFKSVSVADLSAHLKTLLDSESVTSDNDALLMIARLARGSVRDSLSLLDRVLAYAGESVSVQDVRVVLGLADGGLFGRLAKSLVERNAAEAFEVVADLVDYGHDLRQFGGDFLEYLRDMMLVAADARATKKLTRPDGELTELAGLAKQAEMAEWIAWFDLMVEGQERIARSEQARFMLELTLAKMMQVGKLKPIDELLAGVKKLAQSVKDAPAASANFSGSGNTGARNKNVVDIDSRRPAHAPASAPVPHEPPPIADADAYGSATPDAGPQTRAAVNQTQAATQPNPQPVAQADPGEAAVIPKSWDELVDQVKSQSRILWSTLRKVGGELSGTRVDIEVEQPSRAWEQLRETQAQTSLSQLLSRIMGQPIALNINPVARGHARIASIDDMARRKRASARRAAVAKGERDPRVMMVREVFEGGEVTVKPLEKVEKG